MKKFGGFLFVSYLMAMAMSSHAQQMPQDSWKHYGEIIEANVGESFLGIASGSDGLLYVGVQTVSNQTIAVFDADGTELRRFGAFDDIRGIAASSQNEVYVFDLLAMNKISVFDTNGNPLREWGSEGAGDGQFASTFSAAYGVNENYTFLGISPDDTVYALDPDNYRVQSFSSAGQLITKFGSQGDLLGQFSDKPTAVACIGDEAICVYAGWKRSGDIVSRITMFDSSGTPVDSIDHEYAKNLAASPDGLLLVQLGTRRHQVYDQCLNLILESDSTGAFGNERGAAIATSGKMFLVGGSFNPQTIYILPRQYGATDSPLTPSGLPQPSVLDVSQRSGTTLLDIDYQVLDSDSSTVEAYPLAFVDGGSSLQDVLFINTFMDGTETNVGAVVANTSHRLTWNAGADWNTDFGQLEVEVLANDGRGLLPFHWITLPTNGVDPEITISADPVADEELISVWFWLIAKGEPSIELVDGSVLGVGGSYDGVSLASGATTSSSGRQFLYEKMGVRAVTGSELTRAQSGNYNFNSLSTDSVVKLP